MIYVSYDPKILYFAIEVIDSSDIKPINAKELEPSAFWALFSERFSLIEDEELEEEPYFVFNSDIKENEKTFYRLNIPRLNISVNPLALGVLALLDKLPTKTYPFLPNFKIEPTKAKNTLNDKETATVFANMLLRHEIGYYLDEYLAWFLTKQALIIFRLDYIYHKNNS